MDGASSLQEALRVPGLQMQAAISGIATRGRLDPFHNQRGIRFSDDFLLLVHLAAAFPCFSISRKSCGSTSLVFPLAFQRVPVYNKSKENDPFHLEKGGAFMRTKDPVRMEQIRAFVETYCMEKGDSPSVSAIARGVGIAKTTAYRYLLDMNERGIVSYDGCTIETPRTEKRATAYISAPLVGSVRCGDPEAEEEQVEAYVNLPVAIFGDGDLYLLRAAGDSMVDAGIEEGDLVLIRRQHTCKPGDIVVALDGNGENTLKVYSGPDPETGLAVLSYANARRYSGRRILLRELTVQGVALKVIKDL